MKTKVFSIVLLALVCSVSLVANVHAHDIDGDGYSNWYDLKRVVLRFGETGEPGWIPEDVNSDGWVNVKDVLLVAVQMQITPANIDIWPDTVVVPPQGPGIQYVTAFIELPEADVDDIDTASIDLLLLPFIEGVDNAQIVGNILKARFRADGLIEYLRGLFPNPGLYSVTVIIGGVVLPGVLTFMENIIVNVRIV